MLKTTRDASPTTPSPSIRSLSLVLGSLGLVPLLATVHCGSPPSESTGTTTEPLYGGTGIANLWHNGYVPVCFVPANNPAASDKELAQEIVEDTWGRVAPLDIDAPGSTSMFFDGVTTTWPNCSDNVPANHPNTVAIALWGGSGPGDAEVGDVAGGWTPININTPAGVGSVEFRYQVMHEFGHVLGFEHDQDRPDNWTGGPGNWQSIYCPGGAPNGPIVGGTSYSGPDNDSIMSYCNGNHGILSPLDVVGIQAAYGQITPDELVLGRVAAAGESHLMCQHLANSYQITPFVSWGFAGPVTQQVWAALSCNNYTTGPENATQQAACQTVSDLYGVVAGSTWGFAPPVAQTFWAANNCNNATPDGLLVKPSITMDVCQRAADTYGIVSGNWGTAPAGVQAWWSANGCAAKRRNPDACQHFSEYYGTVAYSDWGWAPTERQSWWSDHGCETQPGDPSVGGRCQFLSDQYQMSGGSSPDMGFSPPEAQTWFTGHACTTTPASSNGCLKFAELYDFRPNITWGAAPVAAQSWAEAHNCNTVAPGPRFHTEWCQATTNQFAVNGRAAAPSTPLETLVYWKSQCRTGGPSYMQSGPSILCNGLPALD